jgi:hypothetical protein
MFSPGSRYAVVPLGLLLGFLAPIPLYFLHRKFPNIRAFSYINLPIIFAFSGVLSVGISSAMLSYFIIGFTSQFWLRRYKPEWFIKYNYVLAAALDGGTQVVVFVLTYAVLGGIGPEVPFPKYWGNNVGGNFDYCMKDPAGGAGAGAVLDADG